MAATEQDLSRRAVPDDGFSAIYKREKWQWGDEEHEYEWEEAARSLVAGIYLDDDEVEGFSGVGRIPGSD